ncbi:hypothetical protein M885DRAFT_512780 [Pelagophyceae sp. CCMP2097]|nr:hypothetical protein M885DRAFT_512780 [Pelagophyceae sp. CCMP2097]|mmetsp:Transcript_9589/g.33695  ORF Transcript_9589/g.33695 Transcript_9589/m.33695 type:complete len:410 (+) Transcript_9589:33-1262(+)
MQLLVLAAALACSSALRCSPAARATTRCAAVASNPMADMMKAAQILGYEASAAVISAKISAKMDAKGDALPASMVAIVQEFLRTYLLVVARDGDDPMLKVPVLKQYLELVEDQIKAPFAFEPYHKAWAAEAEVDHLLMDTDFMAPLLDRADSRLSGLANLERIQAQLAAGDNVVLLSNHQTEADPSAWSFILDPVDATLSRRMIMVAGDRVTTDPVAVPFSKGRNLLCIYSKRHMENPPEDKPRKMRHNAKTMSAMLGLFREGGKLIWVAPSGGRDRPDSETDKYACAPFDAKSVDMFRLMSSKAKTTKTHFYPVAMMTHRLFPPPKKLTPGALGEPRIAMKGSVNVAFGDEIDFGAAAATAGDGAVAAAPDADAARDAAALRAHGAVQQLYAGLVADAVQRKSPYYDN